MANTKSSNQISTVTFIGMTCALVASVRNIPDVAAAGWTMLFYMLVAVLFYAFPVSLISGEFAGMFPGAGGPELWVSNSLGKKWGFVVSWLLWVQMFPGMVMVASALAPLFGNIIDNVPLGLSSKFTLVVILVVYWLITFLNLKFDMAKLGGKIGVWLGLYIPLAMMLLLGTAAWVKTGLIPNGTLGHFTWEKLVPDITTAKSLQYFTPVMFIFTGIEMSSVYITRLKNPVKTYLKGIFIALIFLFIVNILNAFVVANVIPNGKMELNNIAQSITIYCQVLGLPHFVVNLFSLLVFIGVAVQLSAWASGPAKTVVASARKGYYPPKFHFWKTNKFDVSKAVILTQSTIISIFAFFYLLIPGVNQAFLMLVNATTVLYCLVYIIMGIAFLKLRQAEPELERPFRIGKKGSKENFAAGLTAGILFTAIIVSVGLTLKAGSLLNLIAVTGITGVMFLIPLGIEKIRKPGWEAEIKELMKKEEEQ
ncbi:amino acid permease [Enterococcus sp. BWM-S5]|uniref:Amino acid permease n=1 Tax=Enterococcus larvae TaxID=2794352 RepID=A0ABS4CJG2_9ENTE|nr:amino acid permease [Enterococcus larvae]MBP1046256.1 amino acid permease [Enterococcus larvae]